MPLTDLSYLTDFCAGDRERMSLFIRMYLQTAPDTFLELKQKLEQGDAAGLASVAHSLKPQVIHMGAQSVLDLLARIEQCARNEGAAACKPLIDEVLTLSEHVNEELRSHENA